MEEKNGFKWFTSVLISTVLTALILFLYRYISKEFFPDFYSTTKGKVSSFGSLVTDTSGYYTENGVEDIIFSIASSAVFSFSFEITN